MSAERISLAATDGEIQRCRPLMDERRLQVPAGKCLHVDDLVTASGERSEGNGDQLSDWLVGRARESRCDRHHLDSGVQRFDAHRFHLRKRMAIAPPPPRPEA